MEISSVNSVNFGCRNCEQADSPKQFYPDMPDDAYIEQSSKEDIAPEQKAEKVYEFAKKITSKDGKADLKSPIMIAASVAFAAAVGAAGASKASKMAMENFETELKTVGNFVNKASKKLIDKLETGKRTAKLGSLINKAYTKITSNPDKTIKAVGAVATTSVAVTTDTDKNGVRDIAEESKSWWKKILDAIRNLT